MVHRRKKDQFPEIPEAEVRKNFNKEVAELNSGKYQVGDKEYDKILDRISLLMEIGKRKGIKLPTKKVFG